MGNLSTIDPFCTCTFCSMFLKNQKLEEPPSNPGTEIILLL